MLGEKQQAPAEGFPALDNFSNCYNIASTVNRNLNNLDGQLHFRVQDNEEQSFMPSCGKGLIYEVATNRCLPAMFHWETHPGKTTLFAAIGWGKDRHDHVQTKMANIPDYVVCHKVHRAVCL